MARGGMKGNLALWAIVCALALGGAYLLGRATPVSAPTGSQPEVGYVGFEPAEIDLGDQFWDTLLPFELTFVNKGDRSVTMQSITSSCDCVIVDAASYEGRTVDVGETFALPLTLDTGQHPGERHRTIKLMATSGQKYVVELFVNVYGTWSLTPDSLDFGEVLLGDPEAVDAERTLTFVSQPDQLVGEPEIDVSWLRCFVAHRSEEKTDILIRVLKDALPPGVSTADVVLRTTSSVRPDTAVYVRVRAIPALVATPPNVFLVGDETKRVRFADREGNPVRIVRAEPSNDSIAATIVSGGEQIELVRPAHRTLTEAATVHVEDETGRITRIVVSAF